MIRKFLYCIVGTLALLLSSCNSNDSGECQASDEAVEAVVTVDNTRLCYEWANLSYPFSTPRAPFLRIASVDNPDTHPQVDIQFEIPTDQIIFGEVYDSFTALSVIRDVDGSTHTIDRGNLIVEGSNYPNTSTLNFYGSFDLVFIDQSGEEVTCKGQFSLKL